MVTDTYSGSLSTTFGSALFNEARVQYDVIDEWSLRSQLFYPVAIMLFLANFVFVLLGLAIPEQAVILPQHELFAWLRLHNSYPGLILPGLIAPFGVFFMTTYMRGIPRDRPQELGTQESLSQAQFLERRNQGLGDEYAAEADGDRRGGRHRGVARVDAASQSPRRHHLAQGRARRPLVARRPPG